MNQSPRGLWQPALLLIALLISPVLAAQQPYIPDALAEWRDWVLDGKDYRNCPFYFDRSAQNPSDFVCAWPETLQIAANAQGAQFTQRWQVAADNVWIPLPGSEEYWPGSVTANGSEIAVVLHDGIPGVQVDKGSFRIAGRFHWDTRPAILPVPPQSGLVSLDVDGARVARLQFERGGVFLGNRATANQVADSVRIDVYRLLGDDVPTHLTTILQLNISGTVREELFAPILPDGFVPMSIQSLLPARLENDGRLRLQVRPGRYEVTLLARAPEVLAAVQMPAAEGNLPATEIWSFGAFDKLRVAAAEGPAPVDPSQVGVPGQWQQLPAFRMSRGDTLNIVERSRGVGTPENDLGLSRQMWLAFDGGGYTVRDTITGTMRRDWRLDMRLPYVLQNASENGQTLLVTDAIDSDGSGVELRRNDVALMTIASNPQGGAIPITGWDERFSHVDTTLYLPPGNKLFAAPGVDNAPASWTGHWQLLDFFLVLIISIAAWRMFGIASGIIALLALVLSFHEHNAPAWLWLNLLVVAALLRVAPLGRLLNTVRVYAAISVLFLLIALVPFVASQMRIAIYPQLEPQFGNYAYSGKTDYYDANMPAAAPPEADAARQRPNRDGGEMTLEMQSDGPLEEIMVSGALPGSSKSFTRYAPNTIVQAGPGIPSWQWNIYRLAWNGPVDADQNMTLIILPRWLVSLLRCIEVLLLLLFLAVVAADIIQRRWRLPGGLVIGRAATPAALCLLLGAGLLAGGNARAQLPSPDMLQELENRLLKAPDCVPRCAEITEADVSVGGDRVSMILRINALEDVAIPLPGSARGWQPDAVVIDGEGAAEVLRAPDQQLWLRVRTGQQEVRLQGATGPSDTIELHFPTPARHVSVDADGWQVSGIKDQRLLSGALQLVRIGNGDDADDDSHSAGWESSRFPPFVNVVRTIELGLDWTVTTIVQRQAPAQGAISLRLPLLDGELVQSENLTVEDGRLLVSMNPTQSSVAWQSRLPRQSPLVLTAAGGMPWKENWFVSVGSIWHASFVGVPESQSSRMANGVRTAEFYPRGGESLEITATRPEASAGSTLAFDQATVTTDQGARSRTVTLVLSYRSTRGEQHVIQLPADAELMLVKIDDRPEALRADAGRLVVPIVPGEHSLYMEWREATGTRSFQHTPEVDIGAPASNIDLQMDLPISRWLLLASGPQLGPAVLYWSELVILVLLALVLARLTWTPLRFHHWLLLGLGFSTFSWHVLGLVALWILVVAARDRWRFSTPAWRYNLQQVAVILLTAVALLGIVASLPQGLLGTPDMHVAGHGSYGNHLQWFADRTDSNLPRALAISLPIWVYKVLILAWSLWLSFALIKWLPWTWQVFARDGFFRSRDAGSGNPDSVEVAGEDKV
jgi:hypothetical protein